MIFYRNIRESKEDDRHFSEFKQSFEHDFVKKLENSKDSLSNKALEGSSETLNEREKMYYMKRVILNRL